MGSIFSPSATLANLLEDQGLLTSSVPDQDFFLQIGHIRKQFAFARIRFRVLNKLRFGFFFNLDLDLVF